MYWFSFLLVVYRYLKKMLILFLRELYNNYGTSGTMTKYQAKSFRSARLDNSLKTKG